MVYAFPEAPESATGFRDLPIPRMREQMWNIGVSPGGLVGQSSAVGALEGKDDLSDPLPMVYIGSLPPAQLIFEASRHRS